MLGSRSRVCTAIVVFVGISLVGCGGTQSGDTGGPVTVSVSPSAANVESGNQLQFTAAVHYAADPSVTWSATAGTITQGGLFTAPATAGQIVISATSNADQSKYASAVVTVTPLIGITVSPAIINYMPGDPQPHFTATVAGTADQGVNWTSSDGNILSGYYYPGPEPLHPGFDPVVATITATSVADPSKFATAQVLVNMPITSFTAYPPSLTLRPGERWRSMVNVRANHEDTARYSATWIAATGHVVQNAPCAMDLGVAPEWRAPAADGRYTLRIVSSVDPAARADIPVTVQTNVGTNVTGPVLSNTTWTASGSPYYLVGQTQIDTGVVLTIEPGVEVHGQGAASVCDIGSGGGFQAVSSRISASGTPESRIRFFAVFADVALGYSGTADLSNVEVYGGSLSGTVHADNSDFFKSSIALTCTTACIGNRFLDASVRLNGEATYSLFYRLPDASGNLDFAALEGPSTVLHYNYFTAPRTTYMLRGVCDAVDNYWSTTDAALVQKLIFDKSDDLAAGCYTNYLPMLAQPDPATPPLP